MLSEQARQSLQQFVDRSDKEYALYFVGRHDVIAGIEKTVEQMQQLIAGRNVTELIESAAILSDQRTWLVQGAPGAGKTALQSHLRQMWEKRPDGPITIGLAPGELEDETALEQKIAYIIRKQYEVPADRFWKAALASALKSLGSSLGFKMRQTKRRGTLINLWQLFDHGWFNFILERLPAKFNAKPRQLRPIVFMIDEIQSLQPPSEKLLMQLHLGQTGLPIVMVLAGLAWSESRLSKAGISRFSHGHVQTLAPLTKAEAAEAVHRLLQEHDIEGYQDADIVVKIAVWSNGWPQHLHNYMRALAAELLRTDGDLPQVDEVRVHEMGDADRKDYYTRRLNHSKISVCKNLLADVAEMIGEHGVDESELLYLLRDRSWDKRSYPTDTMPQSMKPQEFIDEMIKNGMTHKVDSYITIPIPSFRQHLVDRRLNR